MEKEKFFRKTTQDNFITEKVDIFKNNLLGEYDDEGNYEIAPQIVNELIELKKVRKSSYENSMFCVGNLLGFGEISFEICYDKSRDKDNNATAYLYVLEDVDKINGYLQNILKTKISEFSSTDSDFIEETYAKFNVTDESQDDEGREKKTLDDLELEDSYILAKKAYMLLLGKLSEEKVLDAYGKYFTARLTTLTKLDNEFSNAVLQNFNQRYELIENLFLKEKNYKALNELLDACIEGVSGTKEIYIDQEKIFCDLMKEHLDAFSESINKLNDKAEQKAIDMLDPDDRKKLNQMNDSLNADDENKIDDENAQDKKDSSIESEISESFQNPVLFENEEEQKSQENDVNETTQGEIGIVEQILKMQEEKSSDDDISQEYVDSNADFQKMRKNDRLSNINDRLSRLSNSVGAEDDNEREESSTNTEENVEQINNSSEEDVSENPSQEISYFENEMEMPMLSEDDELDDDQNDQNKLNKQRFSALFDYLEKKQDEQNDEQNIEKTDSREDETIQENKNDFSM